MTDNTFLKKLSRTFFAGLVACLFIGTATNAAHAACATNEIDVLGDGTQCETSKFEVTTTELSANDYVEFKMSAGGTFYVDCGNDGTLDVSGKTIARSASRRETSYKCTYSTGGVKTIRFGGGATAYYTGTVVAAISFFSSYQSKIASIDGSLGAIFPVINGNVPLFYNTFSYAKITSIPAGLFSGINTSSATNTSYMFYQTFYNCTSLNTIPTGLFDAIDTSSSTNTSLMFSGTFSGTKITSIPTGLFSGIDTSSSTDTSYMLNGTFSGTKITSIPTGLFNTINTSSATNTSYMFYQTFYNCTSLTSIPTGLFNTINTSSATNTSYMFYRTFYNCTSLTSIPTGLFDAIDTSSSTNTSYMFNSTFRETKITSIPSGLFSGIDTASSTNTSYMFSYTFGGTKITSIPTGLFDAIDTSSSTNTSYMFNSTFRETKITSIPAGLFSAIDTSSSTNTSDMFSYTFANCTSLTGYIPPTAFPNTITPGSSSSTYMWYLTFANTQLATTCPAGTTEYNTGFQNDWGYSNGNTTTSGTYRVSCEPCPNSLPTGASWVSGTCNFTCENGYHVYSLNLATEIGTVAGGTSNSNKYGYISNNGNLRANASTYELTENGTFALEYANNKGMIKGRAQCSRQVPANKWYNDANRTFSNDHFVSTLPDSTGPYCWCTLDEYTPVDGAPMSLSGPWVFANDYGSASNCADYCAGNYCANSLGSTSSYYLAYRSAVLGSLTGDVATCAANVITINWSGASAADIAANTAGTVTYGGDIRTPRAATIIPGKVFLGWKFSAPGE